LWIPYTCSAGIVCQLAAVPAARMMVSVHMFVLAVQALLLLFPFVGQTV
jgi:hypothetical protein